jgi:hypothetical protein
LRIRLLIFLSATIFSLSLNASEAEHGGGGEEKKEEHGSAKAAAPAEPEEPPLPSYDMRKFIRDVPVPKSLWKKFEDFKTEAGEQEEKPAAESGGHGANAPPEHGNSGHGEAAGKKTEAAGQGEFESFEMKVRVKEVTPHFLLEPEFRLGFAERGGTWNLQNFIKPTRTSKRAGKFFFNVGFPASLAESPKKIFFYSQALRMMVNGTPYGAGCGKFMDITDYFLKHMAKDGIEIDTTSHKHIPIWGGTYFLVAIKGGKTFLSRLTLVDSRFPALWCPGALKSE